MKITQSLAGNRIRIIGNTGGRINIYNYTPPIPISVEMNKFIMFYRAGANDGTSPIAYHLFSGSGIGEEIQLINSVDYSANYPYSWTEPVSKKIWVSWTWKVPSSSPEVWGDDSALYTYPASLQSWKGGDWPAGWDFWYYPNGTLAGSGSKTSDVKKLGAVITYWTCSANRSGPYASGIRLDLRVSRTDTYYERMISMNNGELVCLTHTTDNYNLPWDSFTHIELWYLSSGTGPNNNTWNLSLSQQSGTGMSVNDTIDSAIIPVCAEIIPTLSGLTLVYSSGTSTWARISSDYARTFTDPQVVETLPAPYVNQCIRAIIPKDSFDDEYIRLFCASTTTYFGDRTAAIRFIKFNTHDNTVSNVTIKPCYTKGAAWMYLTGRGIYNNGVSMWMTPTMDGNDTNAGDPRFVYWYNENTNATGNIFIGPSMVDVDTHGGACIRMDEDGILWACGSCVRASPNSITVDMFSSNSIGGTYNQQYNDIYTTAGSCGNSFEVFR